MGFNLRLGWERQAFCSLSNLPSLSQLAAHVRCVRFSLPGPVYQWTFIAFAHIRNQGSSAADGLSTRSERGCSRLPCSPLPGKLPWVCLEAVLV